MLRIREWRRRARPVRTSRTWTIGQFAVFGLVSIVAVGLVACATPVNSDNTAIVESAPVTNQLPVGPGTIWVANNGSNDVYVIDESTLKVIARIDVGGMPHNVTVGRKYADVPNSTDDTVSLIDLTT